MSQTAQSAPSNIRQAHWGVISQGLNTSSNFLLSVLVARGITAAEFGGFTVVMVFYMVGLAVVRATGSDVLSIRYSGRAELRSQARSMLTYACGVGVVFGLLCSAAGALLAGGLTASGVVLAVSFPLMFAQEAMRGVAFARGRPTAAAWSDGLRIIVQVGGVVVLLAVAGTVTMTGAVAVWAAGGAVAGIVSCLAWRLAPAVQWPHRWFVDHRDLAAPMGAGDLLAYLPANLTFILMPLVTLLSELGVLRAAYLVYGPLGILILTLRSLVLPDAARIGRARAVHRLLTRATLVLGAVAVGWGVVIVALPDPVGIWLLGDSWNGTFVPRILLGVSLVGEAVMTCAVAALGTFGLANRIVRIQVVVAPLTVLLVLALAGAYGAIGAAAGFALSYWVSAVLAWIQVPSGGRLDATSVRSSSQQPEKGRP